MRDLEGAIPASRVPALWRALSQDTGACVAVFDREGEVVFANDKYACLVEWHKSRRDLAEAGEALIAPYPPEFWSERLDIVKSVCDSGEGVVYESLTGGIRYRVAIRPVEFEDRVHALTVSHRLRPWERVDMSGGASDLKPIRVEHHDPGQLGRLTERELEVLVLIGEGLSYGDIASKLHRSIRTVERHRDSIGQKLGCTSRAQIARFAIRAGLCELPPPHESQRPEVTQRDLLDLPPAVRAACRRYGSRSRLRQARAG